MKKLKLKPSIIKQILIKQLDEGLSKKDIIKNNKGLASERTIYRYMSGMVVGNGNKYTKKRQDTMKELNKDVNIYRRIYAYITKVLTNQPWKMKAEIVFSLGKHFPELTQSDVPKIYKMIYNIRKRLEHKKLMEEYSELDI